MKIKKGLEEEYKKYVQINSEDSYSKAVVIAGEAVGKALDENKTPEEAEKEMKGHGLTGYMAGAVAAAITHFHERGEEFRKFWNKSYDVKEEDDKGGVVNPAIITVDRDIKKGQKAD